MRHVVWTHTYTHSSLNSRLNLISLLFSHVLDKWHRTENDCFYRKKNARNIFHFHKEMFSLSSLWKQQVPLVHFPIFDRECIIKKIIHCPLDSIKNKTKPNTC